MKVLSLFDGCGMAYQALKDAGIHVDKYYASEVDKYAIQVGKRNHPNIIHLGDVRNINLSSLNGDRVDLLIGGSPCQDLSVAKNNRRGLDGERSGLFWEYVRILETINPRYFLLENVNSMSEENKQIITERLGVEPIMINSALLTAQNRKRLYWTNIPGVEQPEDRGILLKDVLFDFAVVVNERLKSNAIDANYYKGISAAYMKARLEDNGRGVREFVYDYFIKAYRKLYPVECERLQGLPDNYTEGISNTQRYKMLGNGFTVPVIAHILGYIKHPTVN